MHEDPRSPYRARGYLCDYDRAVAPRRNRSITNRVRTASFIAWHHPNEPCPYYTTATARDQESTCGESAAESRKSPFCRFARVPDMGFWDAEQKKSSYADVPRAAARLSKQRTAEQRRRADRPCTRRGPVGEMALLHACGVYTLKPLGSTGSIHRIKSEG